MHADAWKGGKAWNSLSTIHFTQVPYDKGLSTPGCEEGRYLRRHGCQRDRTSPSRLPSPSSRAIQLLMKYTGRRTRNSTCVPAQQPRARSLIPSAHTPAVLSNCALALATERKTDRTQSEENYVLALLSGQSAAHTQRPLHADAPHPCAMHASTRAPRAAPTSMSTPASASPSSLLCQHRRFSSRDGGRAEAAAHRRG